MFFNDNSGVFNSSLYRTADPGEIGSFNHTFRNTALRAGFIVEVYDTDNEKNVSKIVPEYEVVVLEQDQTNAVNAVHYHNCISADGFGGIADFFEMKLRKHINQPKQKDKPLDVDFKDKEGTIVLILCLDGASNRGIIIKSLPHPGRINTLTKDKETHMEGEFNGIRWQVNKDGALTITQKTATDNIGKPKEATNAGSQIKLEKDGSIELNDNKLAQDLAKGNKKPDPNQKEEQAKEEEKSEGVPYEKVRIDRPGQAIQIEARKDISVKTDKNFNVTTKESVTGTIEKDWMFKVQGSANLTIESDYISETKANYKLKAANAEMESDDMFNIKAGSQILLDSTQINIGLGGTPAIIMNTQFVGIGNLGQVVTSIPIGPFSSTVFIAP